MSCGAQREKDFPLLDRPELPAEKMRAEFEQGTEQQGIDWSEARESRLPDADAKRRTPRTRVPDRPVRWEILHAPIRPRPQPRRYSQTHLPQ